MTAPDLDAALARYDRALSHRGRCADTEIRSRLHASAADVPALVAEVIRLEAREKRLAEENARLHLAAAAERAQAGQQKARAEQAEQIVSCWIEHIEAYEQLAQMAADGQRATDLEHELRRQVEALGRTVDRQRDEIKHLRAQLADREGHSPAEPEILYQPEHRDGRYHRKNAEGFAACSGSLLLLEEGRPARLPLVASLRCRHRACQPKAEAVAQ